MDVSERYFDEASSTPVDPDRLEHERAMDEAAGLVWPLARVLVELEGFLARYVTLTPAQRAVVVLWVVHCHAIAATAATAYLHVSSAELESGKTRLLETLERLVPRPLWFGASVSTASVYRAVHELKPVLFVDEADNALKDRTAKAELLGVLNQGYLRGKTVVRIGGARSDRIDVFETFCPKAIAGLDDLPPTLASRCLRIEMRRRLPSEHVEPFFSDEAEELARPIREQLEEWAAQNIEELRASRPGRLGVRDRLEEGLRLLLAIAEGAGPEWDERVRSALREVAAGSQSESDSHRLQLLKDVRQCFDGREELPTIELLAALFECESSPWSEWWGDVRRDEAGRVLPSRGAAMKLAATLKPFGIRPHTLGGRVKGYRLSDFEDAFARYLQPEVVQVVQTVSPSHESEFARSSTPELVDDLQTDANGSTTPNGRLGRLEAQTRPRFGEEGLVAYLKRMHREGHLTHDELLERLRAHGLVLRRPAPRAEAETIAAVEALTEGRA